MSLKVIAHIQKAKAIELLNRIDFLRTLTSKDKQLCTEIKGLFRLASKGHTLVHEGTQDQVFFIVISGEASVYKDNIQVDTLGGGQLIGDVAFIIGEPQVTSVIAETDMIVLYLDKALFRSLPIRVRELIKEKMISHLEERVTQLKKKISAEQIKS